MSDRGERAGGEAAVMSGRRWNAFISYAHAVDRQTAMLVRNALHAFAKPIFALRRVRVFLDSAALTPDPDLSARLLRTLDQSQHLILLASTASAKSEWVNQEVAHWVKQRGVDDILIVRTSGEIRWGVGDFDWSVTDALPPALRGKFQKESLWLELDGTAGGGATAKKRGHPAADPQLRSVVGALSSRLLNRPLDELMGEDVAAQRRLTWLRNGAIALLSLLTITAIGLALVAEQQRQQAVAAMGRALERSLAITALNASAGEPDRLTAERSAALALEAHKRSPSTEAWAAASRMLGLLPTAIISRDDEIVAAEMSPDGARLLVVTQSGEGTLHEPTGREIFRFAAMPGQTSAAWSPSAKRFAVGSATGDVAVYDADGAAVSHAKVDLDPASYLNLKVQPHAAAVQTLAFLSDAELLAIGADRVVLIDVASGRITSEIRLPGVLHAAVCGRHAALGLSTGEVRVINAGGGRLTQQTVHRHGGYVGAVACALDGKRIASVGRTEVPRRVDEISMMSEKSQRRLVLPGWSRLGYLDDGRLLAVWTLEQSDTVVSKTGKAPDGGGDGGRNLTQLFDAATGALIWSNENFGQSDAVGFGGGRFVAADESMSVRALSPAKPGEVTSDVIRFQVEQLKVSSAGAFAVIAGTDGFLSRLDLDTGELRRIARTAGQPWTLTLMPDEALAVSVGDASEAGPQGYRRELTLARADALGGDIHLSHAGGMTIDPNTGDMIAAVSRLGRTLIVRTRLPSGERRIEASVEGAFDAISLDPGSGRYLLTGDSGSVAIDAGKELWRDSGGRSDDGDPKFAASGRWTLMVDNFVYRVRDVASGAVVPLKAATMRTKVVISPDGRYVAAMDDDFKLVVTEQASGRRLAAPTQTNDALSFVFDPKGRWLAVAEEDNQLVLHDLVGANAPRTLKLSAPINRDPIPSTDGRFLLLMGDTGLRLLDLEAAGPAAERVLSPGFQPEVAVFSDDQSLVATGGEDRFARVLERVAGREIVASRFSAPLSAAAISHDGRWAAFASQDGTVRVFDLKTGQLWADIAPGVGWVSKLGFAGASEWVAIQGGRGVAAYRLDPFAELCRRQGRNLNDAEWQVVGGDGPAPKSCPNWRR